MRGITIQLLVKTQTGVDAFNHPTYSEEWVYVDNVLVGEPSADEIANSISLYGKTVHYTLGIPKGDTNNWTDAEVILPEPFEGKYKTIGFPTAGIEANIPLKWNKKVKLERYG